MNQLARAIMAAAGSSAPVLTLPTANLLAAWDARAGVTNVSGACSAWADQSGNGFHATQGTAGARPLITTSDGYASLRFDGTADWLNATGMTATAGTKTVYAVIKSNFATFGGIFFSQTPVVFLGSYLNRYYGFDGALRDTGMSVTTTRQVCTYQISAGQLAFWRNGVAATPTVWSGSSLAIGGGVGIGAAYTGAANFLACDLHALFVYNAARNTDVEDYIFQEWGV